MGKKKSPSGSKKDLKYQPRVGAPAYISPEQPKGATSPIIKEPTLKGLLGDAAMTPLNSGGEKEDFPSAYHEEIEFGIEEDKEEEERRLRIEAKRVEIDEIRKFNREEVQKQEEMRLEKELTELRALNLVSGIRPPVDLGKYRTRRELELERVKNNSSEVELNARKETEYHEGMKGKRPQPLETRMETENRSKRSKASSTGAESEDEDMSQNNNTTK